MLIDAEGNGIALFSSDRRAWKAGCCKRATSLRESESAQGTILFQPTFWASTTPHSKPEEEGNLICLVQDLTDARSLVHNLQAELVSKDLIHEEKAAAVLQFLCSLQNPCSAQGGCYHACQCQRLLIYVSFERQIAFYLTLAF